MLGRGQTFFDGVRDKPDEARVDAIQIGKVQRGEVADHHEVHQCSEWRVAFAADRMNRKFAAQIVRQPVDALADPGIFIPMAQSTAASCCKVMSLRQSQATASLWLAFGCSENDSSLLGILIDLRLPSLGCRRADRRVALAQYIAADQLGGETFGDTISAKELFAPPAQLGDGTIDPEFRLGEKTNILEHR